MAVTFKGKSQLKSLIVRKRVPVAQPAIQLENGMPIQLENGEPLRPQRTT